MRKIRNTWNWDKRRPEPYKAKSEGGQLNILTNNLHGTSFRTHKTDEELDAIEKKASGARGMNALTNAEATTVYRIRNKLFPNWKQVGIGEDFWGREDQ